MEMIKIAGKKGKRRDFNYVNCYFAPRITVHRIILYFHSLNLHYILNEKWKKNLAKNDTNSLTVFLKFRKILPF